MKKQVHSQIEMLGSMAMDEKLDVKLGNLYQERKRAQFKVALQPATLIVTGKPEVGKVCIVSLRNTTVARK